MSDQPTDLPELPDLTEAEQQVLDDATVGDQPNEFDSGVSRTAVHPGAEEVAEIEEQADGD